METQLIIILGILILITVTVTYKLLPYRNAGSSKPFIALFPKYKKTVQHSLTGEQIESIMTSLGFKVSQRTNEIFRFSRGSVVGDISIKLAKVNVSLRRMNSNEHELTVEAGWIAAFDTGDHWKFITELGSKFENA